jgi:ABC-type Zn uptake system ZnuABC Zn-binding protein ZnuA
MGDVHPGGNPHFMLDPQRGKVVAKNIADGLIRVSPKDADTFRANLDKLDQRIDAAEAECQSAMAPYRGTKVVTYHKSLTYFSAHFGLDAVDTVEPKPGIPPSPSHVTELIDEVKAKDVKLILMEPWHERRTPDLVAEQTGAKVVEFPTQAGGDSDIPDYPSVCKGIVSRITKALKE